jgi:hypothetical protein
MLLGTRPNDGRASEGRAPGARGVLMGDGRTGDVAPRAGEPADRVGLLRTPRAAGLLRDERAAGLSRPASCWAPTPPYLAARAPGVMGFDGGAVRGATGVFAIDGIRGAFAAGRCIPGVMRPLEREGVTRPLEAGVMRPFEEAEEIDGVKRP